MRQVLTTDAVAPGERLAYWTDMVCSTYVQLECDAPGRGSFGGSILSHDMPGLDFSVVRSRAQRVVRTPHAISAAADDYVIVSLQTRGQGFVSQDGRDAVVAPGDFAIYDSTRPYVLRFDDDFEEVVLKLRGDSLRARLRDTQKLTATTVRGQAGAGRLLMTMVGTLRDEVAHLQPASAAAVASAIVDVLVAGLHSLPACGRAELSSLSAYHVARVKQCIDERLRDPSLTIESVAAALGMSVGHLHRVFKAEPQSPSQYLRDRRLAACSQELLDPRRAKASVAQIAFGWGFNDAAHFSRSFKACFGCTARDWRRQAAGAPPGRGVSSGSAAPGSRSRF